ncbi:hypothetical protein [Deinococcus xianganensis]|uniref:Uncharacterized protein n=1 Tax=Deinococcus xianganensis TaxID=1507289 RepID=A0A6I4YNL6_9DEIO|nr:hypothetical protein [Deinococcus xianganensis]MXV21671.1 hypothetical protein [Deinococcus xianganensis]
MPKTKKPPRDLLTLRATDGRRVQLQASHIRAVTPSPTGTGHAHVELYKKGRSHVVQADPAELAAQVTSLRPRSRMAKDTDPPAVYEYSLRYYTPHREPPDGMARIQFTERVEVSAGRGAPGMPPACQARYQELGGPGSGWSVCVERIEAPAKIRSQEHRARQRQANLTRRIQQKAPLFADQLLHEHLAQQASYFAGETVVVA